MRSKLLILVFLFQFHKNSTFFSQQSFKIQEFLNQLLHRFSCRAISHPNLFLFQTAFITPITINPGALHMSAIRNSLFCLCYVIPVRSYLCSPQARIKNHCVSYLKKIEASSSNLINFQGARLGFSPGNGTGENMLQDHQSGNKHFFPPSYFSYIVPVDNLILINIFLMSGQHLGLLSYKLSL